MRLPRDLTGAQLVRALAQLGYKATRQTGSHVRLTCESPTQHHIGRAFYCTLVGKRIVVLHGFIKKTNKTPAKEIKIARECLKKLKP